MNLIDEFQKRDVALKVLKGQGARIDTTTAEGKDVFGIFAALAEFERALISERTRAVLVAGSVGRCQRAWPSGRTAAYNDTIESAPCGSCYVK